MLSVGESEQAGAVLQVSCTWAPFPHLHQSTENSETEDSTQKRRGTDKLGRAGEGSDHLHSPESFLLGLEHPIGTHPSHTLNMHRDTGQSDVHVARIQSPFQDHPLL